MADEPLRPEGKRQRSRQLKPIRLQERDLDICVSLSIARYLSVLAIEWLHYNEWEGKRKGETIKGGWRERYKAYLDQRKADPSAVTILPRTSITGLQPYGPDQSRLCAGLLARSSGQAWSLTDCPMPTR